MARLAAETNNEARRAHHFAELLTDDLAAVTRGGDVHRISADKLRGVDIPADLPGVIEARAAFERDRAETGTVYDLHRADIAATRAAFAEGQELRRVTATAERAVHNTFAAPAAAFDKALDVASGFFGGATKVVEGIGNFLGNLFGGPKLTHQQAKEILQGEPERAADRATQDAAAERAARLDDLLNQIARSDDIARAERHNRTGGATSYDQPLEHDGPRESGDYGRERER
jgi:hypothetical protein